MVWAFWETDAKTKLTIEEVYWGWYLRKIQSEEAGLGEENPKSWCSSDNLSRPSREVWDKDGQWEESMVQKLHEAKALIPWPTDVKSWLTGKHPDAGKNWRQEKGITGWDGWMALLTQWTQVWASSRRWWRTGKPGVSAVHGSQSVGHDWVTEEQKQCFCLL